MPWKLFFALLALGTPGIVAVSWLGLPRLVDRATLAVPLPTLQVVSALQSLVLLAIATALGARLASKVGLAAPAVLAVVSQRHPWPALAPQLRPGLLGGLAGAAIIVAFYALAPAALTAIQGEATLPIAARVLYGGITEEILMRWGLMGALAWLGWRFVQGGQAPLSAAIAWGAIALSALLFGVSHLPAAFARIPTASAGLALYITLGNGAFGLLSGYLFWQYGLESAIIAHVTAHVLAFLARG